MKPSSLLLKFIFICCFLFTALYAQNPPDKIKGFIMDATSKTGIPGVNVFNLSTGKGSTTDGTGNFSLTIESYPARIVFRHVSYFADTLFIAGSKEFRKLYAENGILLFLRTNVFEIGEVTVSAAARKLFDKEPFSIMDYQLMENKIIAIGYRNYNEFKKEILVADLSGKVLWSGPRPDIRELYRDCLGEIYLVEKNHASQVIIRGDSIVVKSSCKIDFFNDFVRPVNAVLDSTTVFSKPSLNKQYVNYFMVREQSRESELMYHAGETRNEQEYRQLNQSIKQEFLSKITRSFIPPDEMRAIFLRILGAEANKAQNYKPVYTELFMVGDSMLLFDFVILSIVRFSKDGVQTGETPMRIVFDNDWERRMQRDPSTGRFYLEFLHGQLTYLIEIDPVTGDEVKKVPILKFRHVDHIRIINGRIYFLYQPDVGDKGKKLYYFDI
ncbi:MAG: carboxypeptidase-like regulatory domain-containing protein [Bacteroidia bacterium]|nr:carboxypeptidase-like regulatory domain-containing protein [Bacteroidia bacterium]